MILCAVFGPLGLFYATKKGGFILIGLMLAIPMVTSTVDDAPMMYRMIALSMPVSLVWSVLAVVAHNRRVSG